MTRRYANKKHMAWIHDQPCILEGYPAADYGCAGDIQAHHLMKPWTGARGMSLKANDKNLVPLCEQHHRLLHKHGGEVRYFQILTGRGQFGKTAAQMFWLQSPHWEETDV
jgi:hypothetical protein